MSLARKLVATDSGKISSTKVWANIGCAIASYIVVHLTVKDKMTWEIFLAYLGTVGGFSQVSKWLSYRYGVKTDVVTSSQTDTDSIEIKKCPDCVTTTTRSTSSGSTTKPKLEPEESGD